MQRDHLGLARPALDGGLSHIDWWGSGLPGALDAFMVLLCGCCGTSWHR